MGTTARQQCTTVIAHGPHSHDGTSARKRTWSYWKAHGNVAALAGGVGCSRMACPVPVQAGDRISKAKVQPGLGNADNITGLLGWYDMANQVG